MNDAYLERLMVMLEYNFQRAGALNGLVAWPAVPHWCQPLSHGQLQHPSRSPITTTAADYERRGVTPGAQKK